MKEMNEQEAITEALFLENFLLTRQAIEENKEAMPKECYTKYTTWVSEGIPSAIGYHTSKGWYILVSGQGPACVWSEKDNLNHA